MTNLFPTDVSLRIEGDDLQAAQGLLPTAANILHKALALQARGLPIVRLLQPYNDGALIHVFLSGAIKQVYVRPAPPPPPRPVPRPVPFLHEEEVPPLLYLLCGMVDIGDIVTVEGEDAVHRFKPTDATAGSHVDEVEPDWHDNVRLGDATDWPLTKASMYSGAMKRVVQAVMGLGTITDDSGAYLTVPVDETRQIPMVYDWNWGRTHGVITTTGGDRWLVEIGTDNGVLAMPLPLIPSTTDSGYPKALRSINDTGTAAVAEEFGGLPSGETFPTGAELTDAIANGSVLQLLTAADLDDFYTSTDTIAVASGISGWAFSETGNVVHNTRMLRSSGPARVVSEHWSITLNLSAIDFNAQALGDPIGSGTATLSMVSTGKLSNEALVAMFGAIGPFTDQLLQQAPFAGPPTDDLPTFFGSPPDADPEHVTGAAHLGWGAVVHVFFLGDELQRVEWVPWILTVYGQVASLVAEPPDAQYGSLGTLVADESAQWYDVKLQRSIHITPQGFRCEAYDPRREYIFEEITWLSGTPNGQAHLPSYSVLGTRTSFEPELPGTVKSVVTGTPPADSITDFGDNLPLVESTRASNEYGNGSPLDADRHQEDNYILMLPQYCRESAIFARSAVSELGYEIKGLAQGIEGLFDVTSTDVFFSASGGTAIHFGVNVNAGPSEAYVKPGVFWPGVAWSVEPSPFPYDKINTLEGLSEDATPGSVNFVGSYDQ